jgi:hypothetical protein
MADITIAKQGQIQNAGDELALYLKVFAGEVITAFERSSKCIENHIVRTIEHGKSAQFPVFGRAQAHYLKVGKSLDDLRQNIPHNERIIEIDGLLTSDALISDLYEAMSHYDVRQEYAKQMGESLAISADGAIIAEIAKLVEADKENITGLGKGVKLEKTVKKKEISQDYGLTIVQMLLELKAKMSEQYVPQEDRFVYMTPMGTAALINSYVAINRDFGAVATLVDGVINKVAGFNIIEVPHLTVGGANKEGSLNATGHDFPTAYKNDVVFVGGHRSCVGTVKLKDLALEQARRAEYQADQIIAKYAMGHGGLRPEAAAVGLIKVG